MCAVCGGQRDAAWPCGTPERRGASAPTRRAGTNQPFDAGATAYRSTAARATQSAEYISGDSTPSAQAETPQHIGGWGDKVVNEGESVGAGKKAGTKGANVNKTTTNGAAGGESRKGVNLPNKEVKPNNTRGTKDGKQANQADHSTKVDRAGDRTGGVVQIDYGVKQKHHAKPWAPPSAPPPASSPVNPNPGTDSAHLNGEKLPQIGGYGGWNRALPNTVQKFFGDKPWSANPQAPALPAAQQPNPHAAPTEAPHPEGVAMPEKVDPNAPTEQGVGPHTMQKGGAVTDSPIELPEGYPAAFPLPLASMNSTGNSSVKLNKTAMEGLPVQLNTAFQGKEYGGVIGKADGECSTLCRVWCLLSRARCKS